MTALWNGSLSRLNPEKIPAVFAWSAANSAMGIMGLLGKVPGDRRFHVTKAVLQDLQDMARLPALVLYIRTITFENATRIVSALAIVSIYSSSMFTTRKFVIAWNALTK